MKKYPITWTPIQGLPGCYDHDHRALLPADHAVMIKQVDVSNWRIYYTFPYSEFLKTKELGIASEGKVTISMNPFQFTVTHELGSFNRCKIAGRFYIEKYIGETEDEDENQEVERAHTKRKEDVQKSPL